MNEKVLGDYQPEENNGKKVKKTFAAGLKESIFL